MLVTTESTTVWRPGDVFLVYPNGELPLRLIELRAGIVAAEKMTILRANGGRMIIRWYGPRGFLL